MLQPIPDADKDSQLTLPLMQELIGDVPAPPPLLPPEHLPEPNVAPILSPTWQDDDVSAISAGELLVFRNQSVMIW